MNAHWSPPLPNYLFLAEMTPGSNLHQDFDETYEDHLTELTKVPGVRLAAKSWVREGAVIIGGERHTLAAAPRERHVALYALDDPAVLTSEDWAKAVDAGQWAGSTRGRTAERQHRILEVSSWWSAGKRLGGDSSEGS